MQGLHLRNSKVYSFYQKLHGWANRNSEHKLYLFSRWKPSCTSARNQILFAHTVEVLSFLRSGLVASHAGTHGSLWLVYNSSDFANCRTAEVCEFIWASVHSPYQSLFYNRCWTCGHRPCRGIWIPSYSYWCPFSCFLLYLSHLRCQTHLHFCLLETKTWKSWGELLQSGHW